MNIGDKVEYVPHEAHALERGVDGKTAWVVGRQGARDEEPEELEGKELRDFLGAVKRGHGSRLVRVRPRKNWEATVTAVAADGTCSLDVKALNGITLHLDGVKVGTGVESHTCCTAHGTSPKPTDAPAIVRPATVVKPTAGDK